MLRIILAALAFLLLPATSFAGEAEVKAAQSSIDGQLNAFRSGDPATAYGYAAPNVTQIFPNVDAFMKMVTGAYQPVYKPSNWSFGKVEEMGAGRISQQVMLVGPDGKDYEAMYTLELQPDGVWRITGVSLRASNTLST